LIVEVENCVSKKNFVAAHFSGAQYHCISGLCNLTCRNPFKYFQAAKGGVNEPMTCSKSQKKSVMEQDVKGSFLSMAVLCRTATSDKGCLLVEDLIPADRY